MFDVYFYGALRVLVDQVTSEVRVQDRISGDAAAGRYLPSYIDRAAQFALLAHESQYAEA